MFDAAGGDALRRQGARPEEARGELFPEGRARDADRADALAGRARRDDGHALRRRGAAAREQPDQGRGAALQHPVPRRQELPVRLPDRRGVSAARASIAASSTAGTGTSARSRAPARCARGWRCCRRCSSCAPARTRCSPTARARACCTRSQRCSAPCVGLVTAADYADDVQGAVLFLQGKTTEVLAQLKAQMDEASAALEFERAARIRDKVTRLTGLQSRQFVESATAGDIDVVAAAAADGQVAVNVVMVRGGRHVGDRSFFPRHADAGAIADVVPAFLAQHYVGRPVPPTIIAAGRRGRGGARRRAVGAGGAARADRRQSRRRAARLARDGDAERGIRDPPEARAEGDAGGPARRAADRRSGCPPKRSGSSASTCRTRWASARWRPA